MKNNYAIRELYRIKLKKSVLTFLTLFIGFSVFAQWCPSGPYSNKDELLVAGYHSTIVKTTDGFSVWGDAMRKDGATDSTSPLNLDGGYPMGIIDNTPASRTYWGYTGNVLFATQGDTQASGNPQSFLLTTTGLYVWGYQGKVVNSSITSSSNFQSMSLPTGVLPADIDYITASEGVLILLTTTGDLHIMGSDNASKYGDSSSSIDSQWHKPAFANPIAFVKAGADAILAVDDIGVFYTWGPSTFLGNGSAVSSRNIPSLMTSPFIGSPSMIAVTSGASSNEDGSYYALNPSNNKIYSLGENGQGQLGINSTVDQTSWNIVKNSAGTGDLENVTFINAANVSSGHPAASALTSDGNVYLWGDNNNAMLSNAASNGAVTLPIIPSGFTPGVEFATYVANSGHYSLVQKFGLDRPCFVGHRSEGNVGDGTGGSGTINSFNCGVFPLLDYCFNAGDADLVTVKTVDDSTPIEGSTINYTISVTNNGPNDMTGVNLVDVLPAGVTFASATFSDGTDTYNNVSGVWDVGVLIDGANAQLIIAATVNVGTGNTTITNLVGLPTADLLNDADTTGDVLSVNITPENIAPEAENNAYTVIEDASSSILGNIITDTYLGLTDGDINSSTLTIQDYVIAGISGTQTTGSPVVIPGVGTVTIASNGDLTFVPVANYNGVVPTITYTLTDGETVPLTDTADVIITVTAVNDAPEAENNAYTVVEDASSSIIGNIITDTYLGLTDEDVDSSTLTIQDYVIAGVTGTQSTGSPVVIPGVGTVTIASNGDLTFVPVANYNGVVPTITYTLTDGETVPLTDTADVIITVTNVNDAPVAENNEYSVVEDASSSIIGNIITDTYLGLTDGDIDSSTLTIQDYVIAGVTGTQTTGSPVVIPGVGTVTIASNGDLTFVPVADYNGVVPTITYTLTDGETVPLTDTADVIITVTAVNDAPVAEDNAYTVVEDASSSIIGNIITDTYLGLIDGDVDSSTLTIQDYVIAGVTGTQSTGSPVVIPGVGTVTIASNGDLTFVPVADYNGVVPTITYTLTDGETVPLTDTADVIITVTAVNDAPVAENNAYTVVEDASSSIIGNIITDTYLGLTDGDIDSSTLTIQDYVIAGVTGTQTTGSPVVIPGVGTVTIASNGDLTFVPVADYNGVVPTITYTLTDGETVPLTDTADVIITVTAVNDAPVAEDNAYTVVEDASSSIIGNIITDTYLGLIDGDVDSSTLTIQDYVIAGVTGTQSTGSPVVIPGVGTVTIASNGDLTFVPVADYNGVVPTITYTLTDGETVPLTDTADVIITVTAVNDAPVAENNAYTVVEDASSSIIGNIITDTYLGLTDGDIDSSTLTIQDYVIAGVTGTQTTGSPVVIPGVGTVTIASNGDLTFVPVANYNGVVPTITYTLTDGETVPLTDTADVIITVTAVNDAPVAENNAYTVVEDASSSIIGNIITDTYLGLTDEDVDSSTLTIQDYVIAGVTGTQTTGSPVVIPGVGTVTIASNGDLTFVPVANYNGVVPTITYTLTDGEIVPLTDTADVIITVTAVNDAPVAENNAYTVVEDASSSIIGNIITDTYLGLTDGDIDSSTLTIQDYVIAGVTGTQTTGSPVVIPGVGTVTIASNGDLTFVPVANYNGVVPTITYTLTDGDTVPLTDTADVIITVTDVNDPPVADDDSASTDEDTPVVIDVLDGDTDIDGTIDPTSVTIVTPPTNGTLSVNPVTGEITYTPNSDFYGTDTFEYSVCDDDGNCDTAEVAITVNDVNDPPVADDDSASTDEDTPVVIDVLDGDTDIDGTIDPTSVTIVTPPTNGTLSVDPVTGEITYTPNSDFYGTDTFEYSVCDDDGNCDTAEVAITVNDVNDPPVADDDSASTDEDTPVVIDVLDGDTDIDGTIDPTSVTIITPPTNGTVSVDPVTGEITYTPNSDFYGTDTFEYSVCDDDGNCDTAEVTITVNDVNDPPVADDDSASTDEDTPVVIDVLDGDTDIDGTIDPTSVTIVTPPTNGTLSVDPVTGEITYTPNSDFYGTDTFEYSVCDDDGNCDTAEVAITVNDVNDPPVADDDSASTDEDTPVVIDVLDGDTDIDGTIDPTSVTIVTPPTNGTLSVDPVTGEITYTPNSDFYGTDTFEYSVCDDDGNCDTAEVAITVNDVNDPPVADDDSASTDEDTPVVIDVLDGDTDIDGTIDPTSVTIITPPTNGTVSVDPVTGEITYTPNSDFYGTDTFEYSVCDDDGNCDTAEVTITVTDVNDPPVADDDSASTDEDTPVVIDVLDGDTDIDGTIDPTSVTIVTPPTNGTVSVDPVTGEITYTPNSDFYGTDTFEYSVCDDDGNCDTAIVTVVIVANTSDLVISKSVDNEQPKIGEEVEFTIDLINNGPSDATGVSVIDKLTSGYTYLDYEATQGSYDEITGIWIIGDIKNGEDVSLTITVKVNPDGVYTNIAEVLTVDQGDPNSTPGNGETSEDDQDEASTKPIALIEFPEEFTPNGDNQNDLFEIKYLEVLYPNFSMEIINRYGNKVYQYKHNGNPNQTPTWWNGFSDGRWNLDTLELPVGTYFYTIYFNKENRKPKTGWVYLRK